MKQLNPEFKKSLYMLSIAIVIWIGMLVVFFISDRETFIQKEDGTVKTFEKLANRTEKEPITPLPISVESNSAKIALGFKLFNETKLSHSNTISCATCHNLKQGGIDNIPVSIGINNVTGARNAPTVFNSGFNFRQFWDGRVATLEEQISGPIQNAIEMGSNWEEVIEKLKNTSDYPVLFKAVYPKEKISANTISDAIAYFERSLVTLNAPFDQWLLGNENALNEKQKSGYQKFKSLGCISCHHGVNIGGTMFEKLGVFISFYDTHPDRDLGRFSLTEDNDTKHEFKVPSLRNVALTAPYLHNGSIKTLPEMIKLMAYHQLGISLSDNEIDEIKEFLNSLTGENPILPQ